jgi:hypothetical protein
VAKAKSTLGICVRCHGELDFCGHCHGHGALRRMFGSVETCPVCNGTGKLCPSHGTKYKTPLPRRRGWFAANGKANGAAHDLAKAALRDD